MHVSGVDDAPSGGPALHFLADSDSHIVKGLISVLLTLYSDVLQKKCWRWT